MPSATPPGSPTDSSPPSVDAARVYRDYSQAELDAQYNQATLVPDISGYLDAWNTGSARVRKAQACRLSVPYGEGPAETLDIFPAENGADGTPVMLFIHGGAWKALSKDSFSYPAGPFAAAGAAWVATDFSLLPEVSLDEQVRQNRAALAWLWRNARSFGGDPERLYLCGHSSGAHVGGALVQDGWRERAGLPEDVIEGAVLVSGIYDLEPVRLSARNDYMNLDEIAARRLSPIHNIPGRMPKLALFWGSGELDEFRRQPRAFAEALWAGGHRVEAMEIAGANHFDMADGFADSRSAILRSCLGMMGLL